jgi:hypothetical protein
MRNILWYYAFFLMIHAPLGLLIALCVRRWLRWRR